MNSEYPGIYLPVTAYTVQKTGSFPNTTEQNIEYWNDVKSMT